VISPTAQHTTNPSNAHTVCNKSVVIVIKPQELPLTKFAEVGSKTS
jgi:adenine/guanine phosphoribosyltransferase-like PRPP-binding protein